MSLTCFFCDFFCFRLQLQLRDQYVGCGACRQRPSLQIRSLAGSAPGSTAVAADTKERWCLRLCRVKMLCCVSDAHIAVNFTLTVLLLTHRETHLHKSKCTEEKLQIRGSFTFSQKAELEVALNICGSSRNTVHSLYDWPSYVVAHLYGTIKNKYYLVV